MYRHAPKSPGDGSDASAPNEAWLFAQAILGNPIPKIVSPATARAEREELEGPARFSSRSADEMRRLHAAEAEARHDREILEWAAGISKRAERKLRTLQRTEAEGRHAWRRAESFVESLLEGNWDPSKHPRAPKGRPDGGQWVEKGGGGGAGEATSMRNHASYPQFKGSQDSTNKPSVDSSARNVGGAATTSASTAELLRSARRMSDFELVHSGSCAV